MRTLNRPMFRYGGPIKEGVMHGIREPRRNGGSMGEPQMLNTVGSPYAPSSGGRSNYAFNPLNLFKTKNAANVAKVGTGGQTSGIITQKVKNFYDKIKSKFKNPGQYTGTPTREQKISRFFDNTPVGKYLSGTTEAKLAKKVWDGKSWVTKPIKAVAEGAVKSPTAMGLGAYALDALPGGEPLLNLDMLGNRNILGQRYDPETNERIKGTGISSWWEDEDKKLEKDEKKLTANEIEIKRLNKLLEQPEVPVKSDDEIREEKIQKYRDIMDIKGMNKDAAYDSLIAASQAINSSGDFKGDLKSGKLINQIIQGASKAYDKPKTTKDAIDSLILKGEIEKDINLSKGNSSTQQLAALADASGRSLKYVANARLSIPNSPGEAKSNLIKLKKTQVTSDEVAGEILRYGEDNGIPFKKHYTTEQKNKVVGEGKKFGSVIELIESEKLDPNGTDDGLYVIGLSVVEVENGVPKLRG